MNLPNYQRTIFGYHGCDRAVADAVLTGKQLRTAAPGCCRRPPFHSLGDAAA